MKIIVTGGSGFIGSALVRLGVAEGHSIVNIDCLTYASSLKNTKYIQLSKNYVFENTNILDRSALTLVFEKYEPDAVIHLAAETHVDRSIDTPTSFIQTNIVGTFNLLEVARHYWKMKKRPSTFRFHHVSTDEVFGSLDLTDKFHEQTPYDPSSPYSASKASSDHLVRAWHTTYGLPTILTNCSNNYGPYQFPEKLIPVVILNALQGNSIPVYGDGSNIRDWLYVDDHAHALLTVLASGTVGRTYCIGGNNEHTNLSIVTSICSILDQLKPRDRGCYADLIKFIDDRPGHDKRYAIDSSRMKDELGWVASTKLKEGLRLTIKWYLDNQDWWRPLLSDSGVGNRIGQNI